MPRKPNATSPNAKTAGAAIKLPTPIVLKINAMDIKATMLIPSQYAEKFPATKPDKMFSDAPPSREDFTTSCTCRDPVEVKTLTSSGMTAPANVPQEMMVASFHQSVVSPLKDGIIRNETTYVSAIEKIEVSQTSVVSG